MEEKIKLLNKKYKNEPLEECLTYVVKTFGNKAILASSLGAEDQVLTHTLLTLNKKQRIFILDTLRLNEETYELLDRTETEYTFNYEVQRPNKTELDEMVSKKGPNLFYESIENRKYCCQVRKVEPLKKILNTAELWITGLRKEQSITRTDMDLFEWDASHQMIKMNPLINWTWDDIWVYIKKHKIPYNKLHDKNYPSIGCEPCTRAIKPGEGFRAGRWWWENADQKECGLHEGQANSEDKEYNKKKTAH